MVMYSHIQHQVGSVIATYHGQRLYFNIYQKTALWRLNNNIFSLLFSKATLRDNLTFNISFISTGSQPSDLLIIVYDFISHEYTCTWRCSNFNWMSLKMLNWEICIANVFFFQNSCLLIPERLQMLITEHVAVLYRDSQVFDPWPAYVFTLHDK